MCPWNLLSSSNNFTLYLSSYSVFLSSIAGVMICDYYWVRKGYLETKNLYSALKTGPYYYTVGIHFRAYVAYIAGILINVVGFAGAIGRDVPIGATYIYKYFSPSSSSFSSSSLLIHMEHKGLTEKTSLNFFAGFAVSSGTYYALCKVFPIPACADTWMEMGDEFVEGTLVCSDSTSCQEEGGSKAAEARGTSGYGVV